MAESSTTMSSTIHMDGNGPIGCSLRDVEGLPEHTERLVMWGMTPVDRMDITGITIERLELPSTLIGIDWSRRMRSKDANAWDR